MNENYSTTHYDTIYQYEVIKKASKCSTQTQFHGSNLLEAHSAAVMSLTCELAKNSSKIQIIQTATSPETPKLLSVILS